MKKWVKLISYNFFFLIIFFELISSLFFRKTIQNNFFREYQNFNFHKFGRGYPKNYFSKNDQNGFDITVNSQKKDFYTYTDMPKNKIWGNNIGCFDSDFKLNDKTFIYLAGDSFSWGYTHKELHFGTLLKSKNNNIASCGVSHTGQIHQFNKFKKIREKLNASPEIVIVNVFTNDIYNDHFHPHTTIINGYMVDKKRIKYKNQQIKIVEASDELLSENFIKSKNTNKREFIGIAPQAKLGKFDPRKYSSTMVFLGVFIKNIILNPNEKIYEMNEEELSSIYSPEEYYGLKNQKNYPINHKLGEKNREIIKNWISDSKENNYKLIFSFINHMLYYDDEDFCKFIEDLDSNCHYFSKYLTKINIDPEKLKWKRDSHFNNLGNKVYADYLREIINKISFNI